MIDKGHQNKGYAKEAMLQVIDILSENKDCDSIYIAVKSDNAIADRLYANLGFGNTGEIIDDQIIKRLSITAE